MDESPRPLRPVARGIDRRNRDLVDPMNGHDTGIESAIPRHLQHLPRNETTASGSVTPLIITGVSRSTAASAGSVMVRPGRHGIGADVEPPRLAPLPRQAELVQRRDPPVIGPDPSPAVSMLFRCKPQRLSTTC